MKSSILKHAITMVIKNKRAYLMLSVTIIMSFTFLLSYLIYVDSKIVTNNALIIEQEPYTFETNFANKNDVLKKIYMDNLDKLHNTKYFVSDSVIIGDKVRENFSSIMTVPCNAWSTYINLYFEIVTKEGDKISLKRNEVLVRDDVYLNLKKNANGEKIYLELPICLNNDKEKYIKVEVVGSYRSKNKVEDGNLENVIIISADTIKDIDYAINGSRVYVYTYYPTKVDEISKNLKLNTTSIYKKKNNIYPKIQVELRSKSLILVILFVLLGINLYSSFKNALNERKFEIGVKRAIGASSKDIIMQFFYEGLMVVFANILVSAMLSITIFIMYKWYMTIVKEVKYIFYLSKYSIAMYLIASVFLTVVFSLMFAVQSSRVEIIKYLKSE